jgi:hypothetical protein
MDGNEKSDFMGKKELHLLGEAHDTRITATTRSFYSYTGDLRRGMNVAEVGEAENLVINQSTCSLLNET